MTIRTITIGDGSVQIRTISWAEFYRIRPDLKPANDNEGIEELRVVRPIERVNHGYETYQPHQAGRIHVSNEIRDTEC